MKKGSIIILIYFIFSLFFAFSKDNSSDILLNDKVENLDFLTELEIEVVKELNLARTNPKQYAEYLKEYKKYYNGNYLQFPNKIRIITNEGIRAVDEAINELLSYTPMQPLKISKGMSLAAKDHVNDQGTKGSLGHTGSDGSSPFVRMNRYGKWDVTAGENIDYGNDVARYIVFSWIIDDGVSGRGHRKNIFNKNFNIVGVAFGSHKIYGYMCVMTFAGKYTEK
ncbi:MAG TPA: CAP domain-containing protein [Spirochaetota bacterium]|nr:CAP domain-containing protein [Spirochaetota bacterium]HOL56044.1 CAP domain-containing protein [Spirochaetota bacterium]HPP03190.1 CAP domain-containing protein [Spirochaetota bacterium]